jgi:hypothetical protein
VSVKYFYLADLQKVLLVKGETKSAKFPTHKKAQNINSGLYSNRGKQTPELVA